MVSKRGRLNMTTARSCYDGVANQYYFLLMVKIHKGDFVARDQLLL